MIKIILFFLGIFWGGNALAATFQCSGQVEIIALNPSNGMLQVNTGYGMHYLCQIQTEFNGVHPEVCKAWYSMFLTAQASGRPVTQNYDSTNGDAQNCSDLGSWVTPSPSPYFVSLAK